MKQSIPSEAGHWYRKRDGAPAYEMPANDGGFRPTTLRDFHRLLDTDEEIVPSVTTLLNLLRKPGLDHWKQQQLLESAYTCPLKRDIPSDDWITRVRADADAHSQQAREKGIEIHAAIEKGLNGEPVPEEHEVRFEKVRNLVGDVIPEQAFAHIDTRGSYGGKCDIHRLSPSSKRDLTGNRSDDWITRAAIEKGLNGEPVPEEHEVRFEKVRDLVGDVIPEQAFAHIDTRGSYGGKCDIHRLSPPLVADIKTTEFYWEESIGARRPNGKSRCLYQRDHGLQLAAYMRGLHLPDAIPAIIYVSTYTEDVEIYRVPEDEIQRCEDIFFVILRLWWTINGNPK